jgi:hypothetical protein
VEQGNFCNLAGFLYDGASFQRMAVSGPYTNVFAGLVNEIGQVVGQATKSLYLDCSFGPPPYSITNTFIYDQGSMTFIEYPGASYLNPADINNAGKIILGAGDVNNQDMGHFLYDIYNGTFSPIPTGSFRINDFGQILGYSQVPNTGYGLLWVYKDGFFEPVAYGQYDLMTLGHFEDLFHLYNSGQVRAQESNIGSVLYTQCSPD